MTAEKTWSEPPSQHPAVGSADPRLQRLARLGGIAMVNVTTPTWASNMTLGRYLRDDIGPITLSAVRFLIASSLLTALLSRRPLEERRAGRDRWVLIGMALSGVAIFTPMLYLGLQHTTAVNATLINGIGPLITGVLAALLISEPMTPDEVGGAVVGLIGIIALMSGGRIHFWSGVESSIGDLIVLGAVGLWGLYSVLGRPVMHGRSALSASAFSSLIGLPLLLFGAAWEMSTSSLALSPRLLLSLVYIGVVPGVVGQICWNGGVRALGASGAMVFYNTLPVYGALLGYVALAAPIGPHHLLGGVLIIGGGVFAARHSES